MKDVVSELQREKESHAREVDNLRTEIHNSCKELRELEEENSKLEHMNKTQEITLEELTEKIKEYQKTRNEHDLVVTEVNECEEIQ